MYIKPRNLTKFSKYDGTAASQLVNKGACGKPLSYKLARFQKSWHRSNSEAKFMPVFSYNVSNSGKTPLDEGFCPRASQNSPFLDTELGPAQLSVAVEHQ